MAKRITDEMIVQINELYAELKVKKRVAEALGISPSTVSKYIVEGYIPQGIRPVMQQFDMDPMGCEELIKRIKDKIEEFYTPAEAFAVDCNLSEEEWAELKILQKEILI